MVLNCDSDTGVNIQHSEQKAPDSVCVLSVCIIWEGILRIMQKWDNANVAMTSPVYLLSTSTLQRTHEVGQMGHGVVGAAH